MASDFAASVHRIDSANIDEEGTPMGTLAEAFVASFDSHPEVKWVQLATSEAERQPGFFVRQTSMAGSKHRRTAASG